jgi:hypothetical protein
LESILIRVVTAFAALVAAGLLIAIAVDAGRWQHALRGNGVTPPPTLVGGVAGGLLATHDDIALRRAIRAFTQAESVPYGFDNGQAQGRAQALAQSRLADIASSGAPTQASQADDLLGVLAWGGAKAPTGLVDPADRAVTAFTDAARLDPENAAARFNLEVALRALQATGVRRGPSPNSGPRGAGQKGAGAGTPGKGY